MARTLRAALVTPLTGPLAVFGRAAADALRLWAGEAAALPSPWSDVALHVYDTSTDPAAAVRAATRTRPHLLFGPYGSSPTVLAARATRRLLWNHGGATSRLAWPDFPHVINVLAPASSYFAAVLQAIHAAQPALRTVRLLHATSGFARDVAEGASATAQALGFDLATWEFEPGDAAPVAGRVPHGDVLLVVGAFDDERTAADRLLDRTWTAAAFVGAGVDEVLEHLGARREGLLGPAQWTVESAQTAGPPEEGPDAAWFARAYERATGGPPAYPAAQAFAAGVVAARCLRERRDAHDAAQLDAASRLDCRTLYGRFRLDPRSGRQVGHEVLVVQWQEGVRRVVWPPHAAECPIVLSPPS